jgi:hypothetical protein
MNLHFSHFIYFQAKVNVACIGTQAVAKKPASSNFSTEPIIQVLNTVCNHYGILFGIFL